MNIFFFKLSKIAAQKKVFFSFTFSLLRYRLTVFCPHCPEVRCPIFLEIRNPWGKVMERSGLTFEHFCFEVVKNCRTKKSFFFFADFALVHPPMASVLLSASVERCFVSRKRDFYTQSQQADFFPGSYYNHSQQTQFFPGSFYTKSQQTESWPGSC